jgi:hypothetical protein
MPIRKYGTEPAKTEVREEDNDPETLKTVRQDVQRAADKTGAGSERDSGQSEPL